MTSIKIMEALGLQARLDGQPTYAYADTHKHDLDVMVRCCEVEEANYAPPSRNR